LKLGNNRINLSDSMLIMQMIVNILGGKQYAMKQRKGGRRDAAIYLGTLGLLPRCNPRAANESDAE